MGADMIVAVVAHKKGAKITFEGGREFASKVKMDDLDFNELVDRHGLDHLCFTESGGAKEEEVRAWLVDRVNEFAEAFDGRAVTCFHVRDLVVYVTGGMSWGDVNDECNSLWLLGAIPGLASSMGFVEDWTEVDGTVTPEEEAAAVQSIVRTAAHDTTGDDDDENPTAGMKRLRAALAPTVPDATDDPPESYSCHCGGDPSHPRSERCGP